MKPTTLEPGEFGVILRANGAVDLLMPPGAEFDALPERDRALIGSAIGVTTDVVFRAYALGTLGLYTDAQGNSAGEGH